MNCCWYRRALAAALVGAAFWLSGSGTIAWADVKEGQPAPNIELPATQVEKALPDKKGAKTLKLADLKGKNVVLFFFPKAMTKG